MRIIIENKTNKYNIHTTGTETCHSVSADTPREALATLQRKLNEEEFDKTSYISETTLGNLMMVHNGRTYWVRKGDLRKKVV